MILNLRVWRCLCGKLNGLGVKQTAHIYYENRHALSDLFPIIKNCLPSFDSVQCPLTRIKPVTAGWLARMLLNNPIQGAAPQFWVLKEISFIAEHNSFLLCYSGVLKHCVTDECQWLSLSRSCIPTTNRTNAANFSIMANRKMSFQLDLRFSLSFWLLGLTNHRFKRSESIFLRLKSLRIWQELEKLAFVGLAELSIGLAQLNIWASI